MRIQILILGFKELSEVVILHVPLPLNSPHHMSYNNWSLKKYLSLFIIVSLFIEISQFYVFLTAFYYILSYVTT